MHKSIRSIQKKMFIKWNKDLVWESRWVSKWTNHLMIDGRKRFVQWKLYKLFINLKKETGENPMFLFFTILEQILPMVEVTPRRFGRNVRLVPLLMNRTRRYKTAIIWLTKAVRQRTELKFQDRVKNELRDNFYYKKSQVFVWKKEVEKEAAANKAYARYRWFVESS